MNAHLTAISMTTWISRYQNVSSLDFTEAKSDGAGGDNWSYKTCKATVKSSTPTNQHPTFYRPDAFPVVQPTVSVRALNGKISHSVDLLTPNSVGTVKGDGKPC